MTYAANHGPVYEKSQVRTMLESSSIGQAVVLTAVNQLNITGPDLQRWWFATLSGWQSAEVRAQATDEPLSFSGLQEVLPSALADAGFADTWSPLQDCLSSYSSSVDEFLPAVANSVGGDLENASRALAEYCDQYRAVGQADGSWIWDEDNQRYRRFVNNEWQWQMDDSADNQGATAEATAGDQDGDLALETEMLAKLDAELHRISSWRK